MFGFIARILGVQENAKGIDWQRAQVLSNHQCANGSVVTVRDGSQLYTVTTDSLGNVQHVDTVGQ